MADLLTSISTLINSPPGQLTAGAVLAGIVWKFFERVEAVLTEDAKLEVALLLVGVQATGVAKRRLVHPFSRLVWKAIYHWAFRISTAIAILTMMEAEIPSFLSNTMLNWLYWLCVTWCLVRYAFVVCQHFLVGSGMAEINRVFVYGVTTILFLIVKFTTTSESAPLVRFLVIPISILALVVIASVCSPVILKLATRFDIAFQVFNRKFDIEHKPLSAIGLVAGCIVAVVWWGVVIIRMFL